MDDKGPMMIAVCWIFTVLAILFVGARLYVRAVVHDRLAADDYIVVFSCFCAVLSNIFVTISVSWGNGRHFADLDLEQKENTIRWMMAAYFPGIETLGFPKLAVIALLVRLLAPSRLHTIILWSMGTICCLSLTAMVMTLLLQCTPTHALWTLKLPHNCLAPNDLCDPLYWTSIEGNLIIIAACIPLLQPLVEKAKGRKIWRSKGYKTGSSDDATGGHYADGTTGMSKSKRSGPDALEMSRNRKKVDQYGFTMHAKEESEEDLKKADSNNGNTEDDMEGGGRRHDNDGRIMQTMSVTVAYDQVGEGGAGTTAATRWAAV
ncbi:unnamed protein product [Sordaria macrospora k-hell]|uniref:WGS project CABT00000000 data, contig 2.9 n=1 Tax=Sordaria macrospora (strain ATCC MYA-333 / DSM 997 / K(L3346) / K-hell) TaxID=771870 RepID=F7VVJ1_SORMK|nr:uncharacterized protein SMAC_03564 [Sordaria macrospora k-hell]KAH7625844.1 hypothetical protein B0T09DRAFT_314933 [Sordaria sp. MPI-SDFR-AT-0083]CCC09532.1 unnamed protein product [Sordaria macrospora k-hell]